MPLWQWLLDAAGAVLLLILLFGLLLVVRRRVLSRHGGTFELSVRERRRAPTAAAGCSGSAATARTRSSGTASSRRSPVPQRAWRRNDLTVLSQREPEGAEEYALYAGHVVVHLPDAARRGRARDEPQLAHRPAVLARGRASGVAPSGSAERPRSQPRSYADAVPGRRPRSPPGDPEDVAVLPVRVAGQDEQQVGEPVEVGDREDVHRVGVLAVRRPGGPLGPAADRAGDVEVGGGRGCRR